MTQEIKHIPIDPLQFREIRIAFTGKMRAGKDTCAEAVMKRLSDAGYHINHTTFGDELKCFAEELFPEEFIEGKPRDLFQWFGQTMRSRNENIWVNKLAENMKAFNNLSTHNPNITHVAHIITDLRQPNEYEFCKLNDFKIIKVECDDHVRLERIRKLNDKFDVSLLNHETEQWIDGFNTDYTINTTKIDKETAHDAMYSFTKILLNREKMKGL